MRLEYTHIFGLPRKLVWKWIQSEKVLRNSIPGCKDFFETSTGSYHSEIDVMYGPITDVFSIEIHRLQERVPSFYLLEVKGIGNLGEVKGTAEVHLSNEGSATKLFIKADVQLTGTLVLAAERFENGEGIEAIEKLLQSVEKEIKRAIYQTRRR